MQSKFAKGILVFLATSMLFIAIATALAPSAHAASAIQAASPSCGGRSAPTSQETIKSVQIPIMTWTKEIVHYSECDTQDLVQNVGTGAWGSGGCAAFVSVLSSFFKITRFAKLDAVCKVLAFTLVGVSRYIQDIDTKGGGCGIDFTFVSSITTGLTPGDVTFTPHSFSATAQACPPGVAPKGNGKDLGTRYLPVPAPVVLMSAVADSFTIDECNTPHVLAVLANDDVARNGALPDVTITDVSGATLGTASAGPRYIAYTPSGDPETGTDTLSYTVTDNVTGDTVVGTATITLTECNGDD